MTRRWPILPATVLGRIRLTLGLVAASVVVAWFAINRQTLTMSPNSALLDDESGMPISGPSWSYPMGIEPGTGRNLLALLLFGAVVSISIAIVAIIVTGVLGVSIGLAAASWRGLVIVSYQRLVYMMMSLPWLLIVAVTVHTMQQRFQTTYGWHSVVARIFTIALVFAVMSWPYLARLVFTQARMLRDQDFVMMARALGASRRHVVFRELLPHVWATVISYSVGVVPTAISLEAAMSFFSIGNDVDWPTWGYLLQEGMSYVQTYPAYFVFPAALIVIVMVGCYMLADRVQDVLQPTVRQI